MAGMKFIRTIRLKNVLSYGSCDAEFSLEPLNVFIGPNASGKSNLIDTMDIIPHVLSRHSRSPFLSFPRFLAGIQSEQSFSRGQSGVISLRQGEHALRVVGAMMSDGQ